MKKSRDKSISAGNEISNSKIPKIVTVFAVWPLIPFLLVLFILGSGEIHPIFFVLLPSLLGGWIGIGVVVSFILVLNKTKNATSALVANLIILFLYLLLYVYIFGWSVESRHADKRFSLNGRYFDYDCTPINNAEIFSGNQIRKSGAYHEGKYTENTATTNEEGEFRVDLYAGDSAFVRLGKGLNLKKQGKYIRAGDQLFSYSYDALQDLKTLATESNYVAFYNPPKFEDYDLKQYREWLIKPRVRFTRKNKPFLEEQLIFMKDFIGGAGGGGYIGRGDKRTRMEEYRLIRYQLIISIKNLDENIDNGWIVTIEGNKNGGLQMISKDDRPLSGYIPKDGYVNKYTLSFPNKGYPYEASDKWQHNVFYLKAANGNIYGILSLDIGFVSSFDAASHERYYSSSDWEPAIWAKIDLIHSTNMFTENGGTAPYRPGRMSTRSPIEKPYIPQKRCGGILQDTYDGYFGHHPIQDRIFFSERKSFIEHIKKEARYTKGKIKKETIIK